MECWDVGASVVKVAFNPNPAHHVVAVAAGSSVFLIATNTGRWLAFDFRFVFHAHSLHGEWRVSWHKREGPHVATEACHWQPHDRPHSSPGELTLPPFAVPLCLWDAGSADAMDITHALLASGLEGSGVTTKGAENLGVKWEGKANKGWDAKSRCLVLRLPAPVTSLVWHHKGDYLGTVMPSAASKAVMIHQVSKGKTQCPFRKTHGQVRDTRLAAAVATRSG